MVGSTFCTYFKFLLFSFSFSLENSIILLLIFYRELGRNFCFFLFSRASTSNWANFINLFFTLKIVWKFSFLWKKNSWPTKTKFADLFIKAKDFLYPHHNHKCVGVSLRKRKVWKTDRSQREKEREREKRKIFDENVFPTPLLT